MVFDRNSVDNPVVRTFVAVHTLVAVGRTWVVAGHTWVVGRTLVVVRTFAVGRKLAVGPIADCIEVLDNLQSVACCLCTSIDLIA